MKKVAIGCDPNAAGLKAEVKAHLLSLGCECEDYGSEDPVYANVAFRVAEAVARGEPRPRHSVLRDGDRNVHGGQQGPRRLCRELLGLLFRGALPQEQQRQHPHPRITSAGVELAKNLVTIWMQSEYTPGGRSEPKIQRIYEYAGSTRSSREPRMPHVEENMKKFINDPYDVVDEMLEGFLGVHGGYVRKLDTARVVVREAAPVPGKVGLVSGGGSGHKPAFLGFVGEGCWTRLRWGRSLRRPAPGLPGGGQSREFGKGRSFSAGKLRRGRDELRPRGGNGAGRRHRGGAGDQHG